MAPASEISPEAIERVRPWGVDVSSGVETTAGSGRKDPRKLRRFIEIAKEVDPEFLDVEPTASAPEPSGPKLYDWASEDF